MALQFRPCDREQAFLLPPDMREWLPAGHVGWFVVDVVEELDVSVLEARYALGGAGPAPFDPRMLLAVLVYAHCVGVRSSRAIERACETDVAFRVCAAGHTPDHSTVARFRQANDAVLAGLFVQVLALCAEAGLVKVGVVAVDGTKIAGDVSPAANWTREQIEREIAEAIKVDAEEDRLYGDARGDELPAELADPTTRRARLRACREQLAAREATAEAVVAARAAKEAAVHVAGRRPRGGVPIAVAVEEAKAALAAAESHLAGWHARAVAARLDGRGIPGRPPTGSRVEAAKARLEKAQQRATAPRRERRNPNPRANVTDPDTRTMTSVHGWVQGYNAQLAVNENHIILATTVTNDATDVAHLHPLIAATRANLDAAGVADAIGTVVADAGYCSIANLTRVGAPALLVATQKRWKTERRREALGVATGDPPADAGPIAAMDHRLRTSAGAALYKKRSATVEPVIGQIKNRGVRRFLRRGIRAVDGEWLLACTVHNILKLHKHHLAIV